MKQYKEIVQKVLDNGTYKEDRTNIGTLSYFGLNYKIKDINNKFPLLTTKEINFKNILVETLWFLSGHNNTDFLNKHNCRFWQPWERLDGTIPSPYGYFWRHFNINNNYNKINYKSIDQFKYLLNEIENNSSSRRMVMSAWNPNNALESSLPPCHILTVLNENPQGVINLHLTQRSADIAIGIPYNIAGYALLLHIICILTNKKPGTFNHTLVDAHIYRNHIENIKMQINRTEKELPTLEFNDKLINIKSNLLSIDDKLNNLDNFINNKNINTDDLLNTFIIKGYNPHDKINYEVAI